MASVQTAQGGRWVSKVAGAAVGAWSLLMLGAALWVGFATVPQSFEPFLPATASLLLVGAILTIKRPSNAVGPLAMVAGSAWILYLFGIGYGEASLRNPGGLFGGYVMGWIGGWLGAVFPLVLSLLVMFFPEGAPRGWWRLSLIPPIAGLAALVGGAVALWGAPLPTLVAAESVDRIPGYALVDAGFILGFYSIVPATLTLLARYRAGGGVERKQIKWLMAATGLFFVCFVIGAMSSDNSAVWTAVGIALTAVPLAILFAVLRYRLYDIDRLVSRTVGYGLVLAVLGLVYVLGAVWLPTRTLGDQPPLFVAGATLAAAALFNPLRRRLLLFVDRRFHRSRYNAERVTEGLTSRLRDQVDPSALADDFASVVTHTLRPSAVGVWVRETP